MVRVFKNMSIKLKLSFGFALILVLLMIVGGVSIVGANNIADRGDKMFSYNMKSVDELHMLKENLLEIRAELLTMIFDNHDKTAEEMVEKIDIAVKESIEIINVYEKRELSKEAREIWNGFLTNFQDYQAQLKVVSGLVSKGNYVEAENKLSEVTIARKNMSDKIDLLITRNQNMADKQDQENRKAAEGITVLMKIILCVGVMISVFVGMLISTSIMKSVQKGLLFATALGEGDLTVAINNKNNDELGKLIDALIKAQANMKQIIL